VASSLGESCGYVISMNEPMRGVGRRNFQPMRNLLLYSQTAMLCLHSGMLLHHGLVSEGEFG